MMRYSDKENNCNGVSALDDGMVNAHSKGSKMNAKERPPSQQIVGATKHQMMYAKSNQPIGNQCSQF